MKRVLFISRSTLSHNLLRAVLPLVKSKTALTCAEDLGALSLPKKGKPFHLVLIDWNTLAESENLEKALDNLKSHNLICGARWALMHPHKADLPLDVLKTKGFKAFHAKPFMTDELAQVIVKGTRAIDD